MDHSDNPYDNTGTVDDAPAARARPHTPCGIWSLAVGVLAALCLVVGVVMATSAALAAQAEGRPPDRTDARFLTSGLLIISGMAMALVGSVLGVVGVADRTR